MQILDEGTSFRIETSTFIDQTSTYQKRLDEIKGLIDKNLMALSALSDPPASEKVDRDALKARRDEFINVELKQVIERLFPS